MTAPSPVLEVTDATFAEAVIEESRNRPVVVDFWAESGGGPCRVLSPIIEQVAAEFGEDVLLAKLDTDRNPLMSSAHGIQAIPSVKAFVDGEVAAASSRAPSPREHVRGLLRPARHLPRRDGRRRGRGSRRLGRISPAPEARYREMLEEDEDNADALTGLAVILLERGDLGEEAEELIARAGNDRRAKALRHHIFLEEFAGKHDAAELEQEARLDPDDPPRPLPLGASCSRLSAATKKRSTSCLSRSASDRSFAGDAARKAVLASLRHPRSGEHARARIPAPPHATPLLNRSPRLPQTVRDWSIDGAHRKMGVRKWMESLQL